MPAIGHKEWAGRSQGKWDPVFDMDVFRDQVAARMHPPAPPALNAIEERYKQSPWLGAKLTREVELLCPDGRGRFAAYENGHIYWTPETGAVPIPAHVFESFAELGFEKGPLGYPTQFHTVIPDRGDVQAFERGVLYRRYGSPGFYVTGKIGDKYAAQRYEAGPLGWPISNEIPFNGSVYQEFENGFIVWSPDGTLALDSNSPAPYQISHRK